MGASEVMELVARIRPEGLDDTADGLEEVEESFEETAATADEASQDLEDFSNRFEGAIGVAVGALAVGAGGLLSTVPLIGDAFTGLGAIVEAFGLQLDSLLRRLGAGGLVGGLFRIADGVASAEGALSALAGTVSAAIVLIGGLVTSAAAYATVMSTFTSATVTTIGVLQTIGGVIATVVGAIITIKAAVVIAIAAIVAFAAAYITNFRGVRDKTNQFVGDMIDFIVGLGEAFIGILTANFRGGFDLVVNTVKQATNAVTSALESGLNNAKNATESLLNQILSGVENTVNKAINTINTLPGISVGNVSLGSVGLGADREFDRLSTVSNESILQRTRQQRAQAASGTLLEGVVDAVNSLARAQEGDTVIQIDGREVARQTEGYISRGAGDRGR